MEKSRIAIINSVYKNGSTGRICFELQEYFQTNGYECCTYYGRNNVNLPNSVYFGSKLDNWIHGFRSRITGKHGLYSKRATKRLIKLLDEYNPNVYILNNLHGYYVNYELLLRYIASKNVPVILVLHDCWNFTGHCAHFSYNKCDKWKTECKNCKFLNSYPKSIIFGNELNNYKKKKELFSSINNLQIVCPSSWMKNMVEQSFLKKNKITVINNGIDANKFKKKEKPTFRTKYNLKDKVLILCVAYIFDKRKGIDDIITLSKVIPNNNSIVVVGKVDITCTLPKHIIHIKKTDNVEELIDIYSSCNVFFNPTYQDTYSNVNMEALSCGLPVICYKTGGAYEMIDSRFVVEQGDLLKTVSLIEGLTDGTIAYDFSNNENNSKDLFAKNYFNILKTYK